MKKLIITLILFVIIFSLDIFSKPVYITLCKTDEIQIFSFMTQDKKTMSLCAGKDESYIIFRYGVTNNTALEFPGNKSDSWSQFRYSFYMRGGGAENEALDINYLKFEYKGVKYSVCEEYSPGDNKKVCGIKITDMASSKETNIPAVPASVRGSLTALRDYNNIQMGE